MKPPAQPKTAILFRTHFWDHFAERQFARLLAVADGMDVYVLVDETAGPVAGIPHDRIVSVTTQQLLDMGLARAGHGNLLWFNGDYPLYRFLLLQPEYDYYLQLEYDVVITRPLRELVAEAASRGTDYVGLTKGEPPEDWHWRDTCQGVYRQADLRHQLICLSLYSRPALEFLWHRRLELSRLHRQGALRQWPFCEAFIPTELALGGFACAELREFGDTASYDHWPPYLEADAQSFPSRGFIHPVLDEQRFIDSLFKYKIGLSGYLNPLSLFHRKLRRLPTRRYAEIFARSFLAKARRKLGETLRGRPADQLTPAIATRGR